MSKSPESLGGIPDATAFVQIRSCQSSCGRHHWINVTTYKDVVNGHSAFICDNCSAEMTTEGIIERW